MQYTDLDKIKMKLRSVRGDKVRFSDNIYKVDIGKSDSSTRGSGQQNPTLIFNRNLIETDLEFEGNVIYRFQFTSSTEYQVFQKDAVENRVNLIGASDINSEYVTQDFQHRFPSGCWAGTISAGDYVEVTFNVHMSDVVAESYIHDTEVIINSHLAAADVFFYRDDGSPLFLLNIPSAISVAATYLTAYYIYLDVFYDKKTGKGSGGDCDDCSSQVKNWKKTAEKLLDDYLRINIRSNSPPTMLVFPTKIDRIGNPHVGPGPEKVVSTYKEANRDSHVEDIYAKTFRLKRDRYGRQY